MFRLIGVPIDSAGTAGGTELAPAAFRELGLGDSFECRDGGVLDVRIRAEGRDPDTGVVGLDDVVRTTTEIRSTVSNTLESGDIPFLIGGCCTMVPGAVAGVADVRGGAVGLAHLDGHLDLYDEKSSPLGEAADMPVAVALGLGPPSWVEAVGTPLIPAATWIVGYRDREDSRADGMVMPEDFDPPVNCLSTEELRETGLAKAGGQVAEELATSGGYWVHLDLDIVDPDLFFANDAPVPDGIDWEELTSLIRPLLQSSALAGFSLGCYNPEKDEDGANGRRIVQMIADTLG